MAFTVPTNPDWASAAFLNEIVAGIRERQGACGQGLLPLVSAGDDVQSAGFIYSLQFSIATLWNNGGDRYINKDAGSGGDFSDIGGLPYWSDVTLFPAAIVGGGTNWRRYTVHPDDGGTAAYGPCVAGDIIGPWLFEDMQAVLKKLLWVGMVGTWGDNGGRYGTGQNVTYPLTQIDAQAAYDSMLGYGGAPSAWTEAYGHISLVYCVITRGAGLANSPAHTLAEAVDCDIYFDAQAPMIGLMTGYLFDANLDGVHQSSDALGWKQRTVSFDGTAMAEPFGDPALPYPNWATTPAPTGSLEVQGYNTTTPPTFVVHAGDAFEWK